MARAHTPILLVNDFDEFLGRLGFRCKFHHQLSTANGDVLLVEGVKGLLTFFTDLDQVCVAQDRQVMGNGGLRETDLLHDLIHRQPAAATLAHDLLAGLVGNRFGKENRTCFHRYLSI